MRSILVSLVLTILILAGQNFVFAEEAFDNQTSEDISANKIIDDSNQPAEPNSGLVIQFGKIEENLPLTGSPVNIECIPKASFDKYNNKKLSDVIKRSSSINNRFGTRGETVFRLRGFNQRQVPVLIDGVAVYIPYDGLLSLDRITGFNIKEVNIIKSAPSVIYGPNTMGGAINIITEKPDEPFKLRVRFNDNQINTLNQDSYLGIKQKNFYFSFSDAFSKSHGYNLSHNFQDDLNENGGIRDNSAFQNLSFNTSLGYSANEKQDYRITYNFLSAPWEVPPDVGVTRPRYWRFNKWRKNTLTLAFKQQTFKDHLSLNGNFFYDKYFNTLNSYDDNTYSTQLKKYAFHSIYDDYSLGVNLLPAININKKVTLTPIFLYKRDIHRESAGTEFDKYIASSMSTGAQLDLKPKDRWIIELGVTADLFNPVYNNGNALREDIWALNAQGGSSYLINDRNKLYFNVGRKTRFPTLKELYSGFIGKNIPNPNLKEETNLGLEAGYSCKIKDFADLSISYFHNNVDNLIIDVPIAPGLFQLRNINKAIYQGVDTNSTFRLVKDKISLNTGYTFLLATDKSDNRINNYIDYVPKHKVYGSLELHLPMDITANLDIMYVSSSLYHDYTDLQWKKLGGYPVISFGFTKIIKKRYELFVYVDNLLDRNYQTEAFNPMQGRNINMGLKIAI